MKKTAILLTILALTTIGCKQTTKNQPETTTENTPTIIKEAEAQEIGRFDKFDVIEEIEEIEEIKEPETYEDSLFDIEQIDAETYFALKERATIEKPEWEEITDLKQAKEMLKGRVTWGRHDDETYEFVEDDEGDIVYELKFRNGEVYTYKHSESFFIAYYPQEDILLLEGGHSSDISFNLTTGEGTERTGNPAYISFSPSKKYRLNGSFGGQECSELFIQEKVGDHYQAIIWLTTQYGSREDSEFEKRTGIWLCYISDEFWQSDTVLNFMTTIPDETGREEIKLYYQLTLRQNKQPEQ